MIGKGNYNINNIYFDNNIIFLSKGLCPLLYKVRKLYEGIFVLIKVIYTIKKHTETLIDASEEVGLEINIEKTKYMLLSRHQNVGQNRDIKITNRLFENVSQFKYLGTTVTNQNLIQEEIKRRLNSGNACYCGSFPHERQSTDVRCYATAC
jgi:hypothetical protein